MAHQFIFTMKDLRKVVPPKREILKGIWLSFYPGAKIGVLGATAPARARCCASWPASTRTSSARPRPADGIRIGYLPQEPRLDPAKDVLGNVEEGVAATRALLTRFDEINARLGEPMDGDEMEKLLDEQARVQDAIDAANGWELDRTVEIAMDALRCRRATPTSRRCPAASAGASRCAASCSRSPTCCCSTSRPTTSTPSRSPGSSASSRSIPAPSSPSRTIATSSTTSRAGSSSSTAARGIPWEGNYSSWLEQKQQRLAAGGEAGVGAPAHARARARMGADVAARASGQEQGAPGGLRGAARRGTARARRGRPRSSFRRGRASAISWSRPRSSRKGYGDRLLIDDLSFNLPRGGIVGVIGPNGAGKTTLFRMITGQEKPDGGALRVGETVSSPTSTRAATRSTRRRTCGRRSPAAQEQLELGNRQIASRAYVASFNFKGPDQQKRVGDLSGGERNRVHLAKLLKSGGNLLLLDEPTNDLDVDTLRALEDALLTFAGCAVVISHDRWFLDRIATHMLAFEGDSRAVWFEGNYEDYEADRKKRLGAEADQPHRIRYKPLTRG